MKVIKKFEKETIIAIIAFLIPALLMLLIAMSGEYAPFGKVSILVADMQYQFVDYIGYLKQIYFGNDDLFYSFSKTFGGDMTGFASYYLNNPFFLILLFFPNDLLPVGIIIMMIFICGGCGLTCNIMLRHVLGSRYSSVIFSTAYAMMGFMMAYINCIHYFFSVMLLPLVILGLYLMMKSKKSSVLYIISAAGSIISCYYIGYMILIFTAAFFLVLLFSDIIKYDSLKERIKTAWIVLYTTILSIGISAFSLIAVVLSLQGQKSSGLQLSLVRTFRLTEFFSGLYSESFHGNISDGLPLIYSGVVTVIFFLLYFFNKTITIKERILTFVLMSFLIVGFWIDAVNIAWHGFAHPIGFPYRNSFLFSFIIIFFGYRGFTLNKEGYNRKQIVIISMAFFVYSILMYLIHNSYADVNSILFTGTTLVVSLVCIWAYNKKDRYVIPALIGLFFIQMVDLYSNGLVSVNAYYEDKDDEAVTLSSYQNYIDETQHLVDLIENADPSFYRMEKMYRRTHNDPMMFGYNGLSHFSSCETDQVKEFMGKLGFRNNGNWAFYGQGSTSFADCFMGVKYLISQYDEIAKPYVHVYNENEKNIFYNPYALGIGFGVKNSIKNINMEEKDLFKLQNSIAEQFSGTRYEIYRPVKVSDIILNNVTQEGNIYRRNSDEEAYVEYILSINSDDYIYMHFDAPNVQNAELTVNGLEKQPYFTLYDWCIRDCGYFEAGSKIPVRFTLLDDELEIDDYAFYYENTDILDKWFQEASLTKCDIEKITSSHIKAYANVDKGADLFVLSIPYEKDWQITIDGNHVKPIKVMNALTAIPISEGNHEIEMRYIPRGLIVGMPISILFLLTTFCVIFMQNRKKPQP